MITRLHLPFSSCPLRAAVAVLGAGLLGPAAAQTSLEFEELQGALRTAYAKIQRLEAAGDPSTALVQAAAAANMEASELRMRYSELRGVLEALGIGAIDSSEDEVANRLVAALRDMRLIEERRQVLENCLEGLLEATAEFSQVATPGNPESVVKLASAIQESRKVLSATEATGAKAAELTNARVVSVKAELGVAVLNVGTRSGAKPGMAVNVYRGDKPIANVLITDVRTSVSGAVVQQLYSPTDPILVGDAGRVETLQSN